MARRRGLSFRVKLSLVAIAVAVVPLVAVGFIVDDRYETGLGDANRDWIQEVADNLLGVATTTFERASTVLAGVRTVLQDSARPEDERLATASALVATHAALTEVGVYDDKGTRIDVIRVESTEPAHMPQMIAPPRAGQRFGEVRFHDEQAFVTVYEPLVTPSRFWWLVGELSLVDLARRVDAAAESPNSRRGRAVVAVVDTSLRVLLSSEEALAGKVVGPAQLATLTGFEGRTLEKGLRVDARFMRGEEPMLGAIRTIAGTPLAVVVEIPERYVLYTVSQVRRWVIGAVASAILVAIAVGFVFARRMARPINALVDFASDLGRRRYGTTVRVRSNDELGLVGDALEQAASDLAASDEQIRREQAIRTDLGRYLPRPLVDQIVERRRELSLGGDRRDITVLFADVVGFTPLTERQSAETVVTMLNELFTILTEIVFRHGGMVDKFVGDSVMAIWNAPDAQDDHAARAVSAAEDMLRWLEAGNESWRERFGFTVELAIGINSGEAVVGNFGSETRMEFTAIGDTVNVAARLESIARPNQILVTRAVREAVDDPPRFGDLGKRQLAGRAEAVELFEVRT
ncbi:MAG: adenylate/guanylate cyclase domain-containing protein [Kofleriaceae bacterium]